MMEPLTNPFDRSPRRGPACLSDLTLDRLRLGELEGRETQESTHLAGCAKCRARLAEMEAVVAPALDLSRPRADINTPKRWSLRALWLAPFFAGAVLAALVPWGRTSERSKGGGWHLGLIAQHANGRVDRVAPGEALAPGDRLRFEVSAPTDAFVSVISLDSDGVVTPFAPVAGKATAIATGRQRLLEQAVRLDQAVGPERILLLACPHPVDVAEIVAAGRAALARAGGQLDRVTDLGLPCSQTSFWIRKEVRP